MTLKAKNAPLPEPTQYFPASGGVFSVRADLSPLGTDFGQGERDKQFFQLDREFQKYREEKQASRRESVSKYITVSDHFAAIAPEVIRFLLSRLTSEYPEFFALTTSAQHTVLNCHLTGEILELDSACELKRAVAGGPGKDSTISPPYSTAWEALGNQVQEDLAVISRTTTGNEISALHLCLPNYWSAEDKVGRDFAAAHAPVAGMEHINARAGKLVDMLVSRGPFVRFAWGLTTDNRLNHHPEVPEDFDAELWYGRHFDPESPSLYMRIERQVLWPIPDTDSALFGIRTYLNRCEEFFDDQAKLAGLISSLQTMPKPSCIYKGLDKDAQAIIQWLKQYQRP